MNGKRLLPVALLVIGFFFLNACSGSSFYSWRVRVPPSSEDIIEKHTFPRPVLDYSGNVYVVRNGIIRSYNPAGSVDWDYPLKFYEQKDRFTDLVFSPRDMVIAAGTGNPNLIALSPFGRRKWTRNLDAVPKALSVNRAGLLYVVDSRGRLMAFSPKGTRLWNIKLIQNGIGGQNSDPVIGPDGTLYIVVQFKREESERNDRLLAVSPDGKIQWQFDAPGGKLSPPSVGPDGTVFVGSRDSPRLYALNPDGSEKYRFDARFGTAIFSPPSIDEKGNAYTGTRYGRVYKLNPEGAILWSFRPGIHLDKPGGVRGTPAVTSRGSVYVPTVDGLFYELSRDGKARRQFSFGAARWNKGVYTPIIRDKGTVFLLTRRYLFAITATEPPAPSTWPMSGSNPQNSKSAEPEQSPSETTK